MLKEYKTVEIPGEGEYVEKKSRFLGEAVHVESLEEVEDYISSVRKKHYDARHHCFAFLVGEPGTPEEIIRSSDDGEPSGTAGKPMMEVLTGQELHNTLLIVTRYFGGTLLGTGGLVRSYTAAAQEAVKNAGILTMVHGTRLKVSCTYPQFGKFQYLFAQEGIPLEQIEYTENVAFELLVPEGEEKRIEKIVSETTDGRGGFEQLESLVYEKRL